MAKKKKYESDYEPGGVEQELEDAQAGGRAEPDPDIEHEPLQVEGDDELKAQLAEALDERMRAMAELENIKRRLAREKEEFTKYAVESVLGDLLPVLDNLDLALAHGAGVEACKDFLAGVDMTRKVFLDTLNRHGLTPLGEVGDAFNPEFHEAVGVEKSDEAPSGGVSRVVQKGYVLRGRLLRPAKVLVNQ
jgi:molecular chaperone GrpE